MQVPSTAVLLLLAAHCLAVPGGYLVDGISDEFDSLDPMWGPGLRGMPESLTFADGILSIRSVDNGDDAYPSAEDMTSTYSDRLGRYLYAEEEPSVVAWIWLPPFDEWPQGTNLDNFRQWFAVRVTAYDPTQPYYDGFYWPGIYIANDDDGPCLVARVGDGFGADTTIGRITTSGWWTVGLSWNAEGRTEYYAAPGRVVLTAADLLHTVPDDPFVLAANRSIDQLVGSFLAIRMTYPSTNELSPDWRIDSLRIYVNAPHPLPTLTPSTEAGGFRLDIAGCERGFRYLLLSSEDLVDWNPAAEILSDGAPWTVHQPATTRRFYRIARP